MLLKLIGTVAPFAERRGDKVFIHETHHTRKLDAPSGTAKAMAVCLGEKIKAKIESSRIGDVVGVHEIRFEGPHDVLTLKHEAIDRSIFAQGALQAALWAAAKNKPGLYSMSDVLF
jgi:4-hydroxy-tetrahydrodipicolinate reductase